jgi:hypothetical protein
MIKRLISCMFIASSLQAMVFDNRYLPLFLKPYVRRCDAFSHFRFQPFFMRADRAFGDMATIHLPDLEGSYDLRVLGRALSKTGVEDFLRSDLRTRGNIPWEREGHLEAQGLALYYEYAFNDWFSVGINTLFAHISSRHEFFLRGEQFPQGDREALFEARDRIHKELGITPAFFSKTGFGDTDIFIRFGSIWEYLLKCRRIDAGIKFGVLCPTASDRELNNPASIGLGGERHWGAYMDLEGQWELKEDLFFGLMVRASKRFKKTRTLRIPLLGEPFQYGVLKGPVSVNPGWTFVFNPYFMIQGLREGFGASVQYVLVSHLRDSLTDLRPLKEQERFKSFEPFRPLEPIHARSSWGMEYVSVGAFYDFGKIREHPLYPKISAYWDIPVEWLVSKRSSKTHSLSLMLELDF